MQINEFVKRARAAKIHAYIISHLKKEMPAMMGKAKAQQRLIDNLDDEFAKVWTSPTMSVFCIYGCDRVFTLVNLVSYHSKKEKNKEFNILVSLAWILKCSIFVSIKRTPCKGSILRRVPSMECVYITPPWLHTCGTRGWWSEQWLVGLRQLFQWSAIVDRVHLQ